jgi:hypothetical protein
MHAQHPSVDEGGDGQVVKHVHTVAPGLTSTMTMMTTMKTTMTTAAMTTAAMTTMATTRMNSQ